jgi:hypothetical protein
MSEQSFDARGPYTSPCALQRSSGLAVRVVVVLEGHVHVGVIENLLHGDGSIRNFSIMSVPGSACIAFLVGRRAVTSSVYDVHCPP